MAESTRTTRTTAKPASAATSTKAKARIGKKAIVGYYDPAVNDRLRVLSEREGSTMQKLLGQALNLLFVERGMGRIDVD